MYSTLKSNNGTLLLIIFAVEKQSGLDTLKVCRSHRPRCVSHGSAVVACWECEFESCWEQRCLFLVTVVLCQVEVSAMD